MSEPVAAPAPEELKGAARRAVRTLQPSHPREKLRVGDKILVSLRGSAKSGLWYPAIVTRKDEHRFTVNVFWDRGAGIAVVPNPVHKSEARGGANETLWDFAPR